jgi:hypothetical protein
MNVEQEQTITNDHLRKIVLRRVARLDDEKQLVQLRLINMQIKCIIKVTKVSN